ncbi:MAG: DUF4177 domain-containing protein [Paracoccaceae bacterium]
MQRYEYKAIPAPTRGEKTRGAKTTADRFAVTLSALLNAEARDGWEYQRTETLPCEERVGFTKRQTTQVTLLILRRDLANAAPAAEAAAPAKLILPHTSDSGTEMAKAAPVTLQENTAGNAPKLGPADGSAKGTKPV